MSIGEFCNREVVVVGAGCTILEAARLMRQHHVGSLVIVTADAGVNRPVGVLTDRDLVVEVMAAGLDPAFVLVGEVVDASLYSVPESGDWFDALRLMREHGVRRLPVVDGDGGLQGIFTVDDGVALLAEQMDELARLIVHEQAKEAGSRKV